MTQNSGKADACLPYHWLRPCGRAFLARNLCLPKWRKTCQTKLNMQNYKKKGKKTYSAMAACPRLCAAQTIRFSSFKAIPPTVGTMPLNIITSKTLKSSGFNSNYSVYFLTLKIFTNFKTWSVLLWQMTFPTTELIQLLLF